ncbi:MAG: glycosyltransferase family 39 protein [Acidobacteriota bacterium]|nr:glycosyltransferase family 39 protein [Acidobacteriota bacterium]
MAPAWEGYDEPFHFAYLQHVAAGLGPPARTTPVSLEVQHALHLFPIPWELQFQSIPPPLTTYDEYWRLPPAEQRVSREASARALVGPAQYREGSEQVLNYEAQHAPLYWCFAAPLRWMAGEPLLTQLFTLRMLNVLLASAGVPLVYVLARQVFGPARALATTALLVLLPDLMINVARVSNECLTMICYTAVLIAAVKAVAEPLRWRWWLLLGAAMGCGLLTKAYFLTAMPALMVLAIYCLLKQEAVPDRPRLAVAARIGAAFALVLTIAGVLYLRVHALTGSWSEYGDDAALRGMSLGQKLMAVPHVNWKSVAVSVLLSHIWFGGLSFLRLPLAFYIAGFALIVVAIAGALSRLVSRRKQEPAELRGIIVLGAFYVCFWAGLGYHVLIT